MLFGDGMKSGPLRMEFEEFKTDREGVWEKQGDCKEGLMPSLYPGRSHKLTRRTFPMTLPPLSFLNHLPEFSLEGSHLLMDVSVYFEVLA